MFEDFGYIALRAFDAGFSVGDTMPDSFVWVDGECTDEELNGACGLEVESEEDIASKLQDFREGYGWGDRIVYVIGGHYAERGNDRGEIIIRNAKILKVIG